MIKLAKKIAGKRQPNVSELLSLAQQELATRGLAIS
jgi:hypothetical protein